MAMKGPGVDHPGPRFPSVAHPRFFVSHPPTRGELWELHLSPGAATHNQTVHGFIPAEEDLTRPSGRPGMLCVIHFMTFGSTESMEEQWSQPSIVALILQA